MKNTVICNVGKSLVLEWIEFRHQSCDTFLKHLCGIDELDPKSGEEINSISALLKQKYLGSPVNLYLVSPDISENLFISDVLKLYFQPIFKNIKQIKITHLQNTDYNSYFRYGTHNYINEMTNIIKFHSIDNSLIISNGDFDKLCPITDLLAYTFEIPIFHFIKDYQRISEIKPPKTNLNIDLWINNIDIFNLTYDGISLQDSNIKFGDVDPEIKQFFYRYEDNKHYLTYQGLLFYLNCIIKHSDYIHNKLPTDFMDINKKIHFEDNNHGKHKGLKVYLEKLLKLPYVSRIQTIYFNPDLVDTRKFKIVPSDFSKIEGIFSNDKATSKFWIYSTATTYTEQKAVLSDLLSHF